MSHRVTKHPNRRCVRFEQLEARRPLAADPAIGVNLDPIVDFSTAWTFTDVFKTSRPWLSHAFNTVTQQESFSGGGEVQVDENGWPVALNEFVNDDGHLIQQRISTLMFRDIGDKYPAGIYRAEWQGSGDVRWEFAAQTIESGVFTDSNGIVKHFALLDVTPRNAGISMKIYSMDESDPIRDVHLWMPDYQGDSFTGQIWSPGDDFSPFHPAFLESLEPFSVLRFMDWTDANRSSLVDWSERRDIDDARQRGDDKGVAYEYIIELANSLQKDVWLNMPHQANDEFVSQYATLIRDNLDPSLTVYVEYSNEVWNGTFDAFNWLTDQLPGGDESLRWQVTAEQAIRDFDIWSSVFAGQEQRIVRVASAFTGVPEVTESILSHMDGKFDAIEVGSYVRLTQPQQSQLDAQTTVDEIIDLAETNLTQVTLPLIDEHQQLAATYSQQLGREIDLLVYEGGQLLLPDNSGSPYLQAVFDAQTDPRMYDLYASLISELDQRGVDLFNHFTHVNPLSVYSTTGALQYQLQDITDAPKYRALVDASDGRFFVPGLSGTAQPATEGVQNHVIFSLTLDDPTDYAVDIELSLLDGSAVGNGQDFGSSDGHSLESSVDGGQNWLSGSSLTLPPSTETFLVRVPIVDDDIYELDETFTLTASIAAESFSVQAILSSDDTPDIESDLVAHWTFADSETQVSDMAVFGDVSDVGTLIGDAQILNPYTTTSSLQLDGLGDQVNIGSSSDLNLGIFDERSISLFFYANENDRRQVLFEEGGVTRGLNIYLEDNQLIVGGWNRSPFQSNWQGTWLSTPIDPQQWHHVTLFLDGDATVQPGALVGYLNGVEFGRGEGSQLWTHGESLAIGGANGEVRFATEPFTGANEVEFNGFIKDVRVYNRALHFNDVSVLSGATVPPITPIDITISDATALEGETLLFDVQLSESLDVDVLLHLDLVDVSTQGSLDFGSIVAPANFQWDGSILLIPANTTAFQLAIPTVDDNETEASETFSLRAGVLSGPVATIEEAMGTIDNDDVLPSGDAQAVASWSFDQLVLDTFPDQASLGVVDDVGILAGNAAIDQNAGRGGALSLDGLSSVRVQSSDDINTQFYEDRTVSLWFLADQTASRQVLYEEGALTTGLNIWIESGELVVGGWKNFAHGNGWAGTWIHAPVQSNQWNHVALVLSTDGITAGSLTGYLNGAEMGNGVGYAMTPHSDPIGIGASHGGVRFQSGTSYDSGSSPFTGLIDEVGVFNLPLTHDQISTIAAQSDQFALPNLATNFVETPPIRMATDVSGDGEVTPEDLLIIINFLAEPTQWNPALDVNQDKSITPADLLMVINEISEIRTATLLLLEDEADEEALVDLAITELNGLF
ncbi:LamG-like jellyroll fold domain-containing protein [Planctomycetes bacterium K23_9]|uniref:Dockerin type I repeat protein n=1 Tax=Stieleria marina TaxID=1930275 RepID=A0A517NNS4_9BACT|nr:Dockerin type I repeat protein [Planctomycetes bacterium K23_9]